MNGKADRAAEAAAALAAAFAARPEVAAVTLGGSRATGLADEASDIDLYVYAASDVPAAFREALAAARSARREVDNRFFEPGDEWDDVPAGVHVDVMYRRPDWAADEVARVLDRHEARLGYSTCLWHNILTARPLFDRASWFADLQRRAGQPYPEALARAIAAKNLPMLRTVFGSFGAQALRATERGDAVSVNHRTAAFLASWFDVLFAANREPHPGEKRLLAAAERLRRVPAGMTAGVERLLAAAAGGDPKARRAELAAALDALCDGLDDVLRAGV